MTGRYVLDLPEENYHDHPSLSSSGARALLRCPAIFHHEHSRDRKQRTQKDAWDIGSVIHGLVLGAGWPVAIWEGESWGDPGAKAFKDEAYAADRIPIKREDYRNLVAMADAVLTDDFAGPLLTRAGIAEVSFFWQDPDSTVNCRARLDWLTEAPDGMPRYIEYKSTRSASKHDIRSDVARHGYHLQQEWNLTGLASTDLDPAREADCRFIFQEKHPPFPVSVVRLDDDAIEIARQRNRAARALFLRCTETGKWPSYFNRIATIGLPRWATFSDDEDDLQWQVQDIEVN